MIALTLADQRDWLLDRARGIQREALLLGDVQRYQEAAAVEAAAKSLSPEQVSGLKLDYSTSLTDGARIRLSRV